MSRALYLAELRAPATSGFLGRIAEGYIPSAADRILEALPRCTLMLDASEFDRWIEASRRTFESALGDVERGDYNWACFKFQQAAELAVKGLLRGIGRPSPGHSVSRLLEAAARDTGSTLEEGVIECAKLLDKFYIPTRYPDAWSEGPPHYYYTRRDSVDAMECASRVIEWVEVVWRLLLDAARRRGRGL